MRSQKVVKADRAIVEAVGEDIVVKVYQEKITTQDSRLLDLIQKS